MSDYQAVEKHLTSRTSPADSSDVTIAVHELREMGLNISHGDVKVSNKPCINSNNGG